jgi:hypothetical protein
MTSELDPKARELIGLALQGERRLPRQRERVRRGVLAAVAAPLALGATDAALAAGEVAGAAGAMAPAKVTLLGAVTWLKVAPVVALGVLGVVGAQQFQAPAPAPHRAAPAAAVLAASPAKTPLSAPVSALVEVEAAPAPPQVTAPAHAPSKTMKALQADAAAPPAAAAPPSLAAELEALQRAQRSLNAGNPASALTEVRAVGGQALLAERTALEVFAHCALGQVAAARPKAALFRQLAPRSPLLPRVEASCAGE